MTYIRTARPSKRKAALTLRAASQDGNWEKTFWERYKEYLRDEYDRERWVRALDREVDQLL